MKTLCRKAGVRYFRFHPLRHQGASILGRCNVNIGSIQRILGHENRSTTEIYLHSIGEAERDAVRVFEIMTEESHTVHANRIPFPRAGFIEIHGLILPTQLGLDPINLYRWLDISRIEIGSPLPP
jgi:hypothetical protein